jgi:hypothetical protein
MPMRLRYAAPRNGSIVTWCAGDSSSHELPRTLVADVVGDIVVGTLRVPKRQSLSARQTYMFGAGDWCFRDGMRSMPATKIPQAKP